MIELLLTICIYALVGGLIFWLVNMLPIDGRFKQVIQVCMIVIAIILLVGILLGEVPRVSFRG